MDKHIQSGWTKEIKIKKGMEKYNEEKIIATWLMYTYDNTTVIRMWKQKKGAC